MGLNQDNTVPVPGNSYVITRMTYEIENCQMETLYF